VDNVDNLVHINGIIGKKEKEIRVKSRGKTSLKTMLCKQKYPHFESIFLCFENVDMWKILYTK